MSKKKLLLVGSILVGLVIICVAAAGISVIFSPAPTNPPVVQEPKWDSPATRALAKRACFDCHSNETVWPIYSRIPPASILVKRDVDEGRRKMNFSTWGTSGRRVKLDEVEEVIRSGEMPMPIYLPLHPEARLSVEEKERLIAGLKKSLAQ